GSCGGVPQRSARSLLWVPFLPRGILVNPSNRHHMTFPRREFLRLAAGAAALAAVPRIGTAQTYPARPVRVIVPFAPGGPTDVFARLMAQKLSEHMGAQFYVENIVGAGGNIGAGRAAQSTPD